MSSSGHVERVIATALADNEGTNLPLPHPTASATASYKSYSHHEKNPLVGLE